jgi:hypothetical protein
MFRKTPLRIAMDAIKKEGNKITSFKKIQADLKAKIKKIGQ